MLEINKIGVDLDNKQVVISCFGTPLPWKVSLLKLRVYRFAFTFLYHEPLLVRSSDNIYVVLFSSFCMLFGDKIFIFSYRDVVFV